MIQSRGAFLLGGAASVAAIGTASAAPFARTQSGLILPKNRQIEYIGRSMPPETLAEMKALGCEAVSYEGTIWYSDGRVMPHNICDPSQQQCPGGGGQGQPGNGNPQNYPVIGTVVANPYYPPSGTGSFGGAVYTGTPPSGPRGPFYGGIPQTGFGPTYYAKITNNLECVGALGGIVAAVKNMIAGMNNALKGTFPPQALTSVDNAIAAYGEGATLTVEGAGEILAALVAFLTTPELVLVAAFGALTFVVMLAMFKCLT